MAAGLVRRDALGLAEAADLRLGQLLGAKLVRREDEDLERRAKVLIQLLEELVASTRRASSARNVHNKDRMTSERAHW